MSGSIGGRIVTSRLQSVLLHAGHVVQQFRQGLFHDQLSQAVGGTCPFALVLFDICILAVYCFRYKRDRKNSITAQSKFAERFRYNLAAACFRYLVPIGLATAFYVLLSCYVYWFPSRRLAHQNAAHSREHFEILRRLRTEWNFNSRHLFWFKPVELCIAVQEAFGKNEGWPPLAGVIGCGAGSV